VRLCLCCLILLIVSQGVFAAGPGDARITGHIICADTGQPARFATVILQPVPADNAKLDVDHLPSSSSTISGDDGAYVFDSIPAGRYVIGAELQGYVSPLVTASADQLRNDDPGAFSEVFHQMTPVVVDASSTASADIRLERGAALSGTVSYDDGSPSIQATVELLHRAKNGSTHEVALSSLELALPGLASVKTNDLGQYRVAGLPPGDYVLRVSLPKPVAAFSGFSVNKVRASQTPENLSRLRLYSGNSFRMRDAKVVHANGGEEITGLDFIFPLSTLHRVSAVLSSASGTLPKGAQVSLLFADNQEVLDTADPDAETHAVFFSSVPEGTYLLQVKASGNKGALASAVLSVPILVNTDRQNVPLNLP
jgi:protocatechuate 3,4-dioxygenase beta subunit